MLTLVSKSGPRASAFSSSGTSSQSSSRVKRRGLAGDGRDNDSWPIRFQPRSLKDVALSPQSKKKVRAWLERALLDHAEQGDRHGFRPHVLALCGNSGCGKSTLIEALCNEMEVGVVTWSEDSWDIDMKGNYSGGITSRDAVDRLNEVDDMTSFVRQSAYPKLELDGIKAEPKTKQPSMSGGMNRTEKGTKKKSVVSFDSNDEVKRPQSQHKSKIVLMHDLPHSYTASYNGDTSIADDLADLMSSFRDPVVLIVSDIRGSDDVQYASRKLIPQKVRDKVTFESIYQHPPTEKIMMKGLQRMLNECKETKRALQRNLNEGTTLDEVLEELVASSMGDMRHAVLELGFMTSVQQGGEALQGKSNDDVSDVEDSEYKKGGVSSSRIMKRSACKEKKGLRPVSKKAKVGGKVVEVLDLSKSSDGDEDKTDDFESASETEEKGMDVDEFESGNNQKGDNAACRFRIAIAPKEEGRERDPLFSSLHASGKLIMATLDDLGHFSFSCEDVAAASSMDTEMLFLFVQQNMIEGFRTTQRVEQFGLEASAEHDQKSIDEICSALSYCSDVERFLHVKYDSNALYDRSNLNLFPDSYICSIVSRMVGASRGISSTERVATSREKGAKLDFVPQRRPASLDLTARKARVASAIAALNRERLRSGGRRRIGEEASAGAPPLIAVHEVASSVAPALSQMYEYQQSKRVADSTAVYGVSQKADKGWLSSAMTFRVQELRRAMDVVDMGVQPTETAEVAHDANMDPMHPADEPMFLESDDIEMVDSEGE